MAVLLAGCQVVDDENGVDRTGVVKAIYDDNPCPSYEDLSASILSVSIF